MLWWGWCWCVSSGRGSTVGAGGEGGGGMVLECVQWEGGSRCCGGGRMSVNSNQSLVN